MNRILAAALLLFPLWSAADGLTQPPTASSIVVPNGGNTGSPVNVLFSRVLSVDDFGAVGNGTTYDTTAFINACNALGNQGGVVLINPAKSYHLASDTILPDNCTIRGSYFGDGAYGSVSGDFQSLGSILYIDESSFTVTTTSSVSGTNVIPVSSLAGVTKYALVTGSGIEPGSYVYGTNSGSTSITLNVNVSGTVSSGTTITIYSAGLIIGNQGQLDHVQILRYGIPSTPVGSSTAYQAETAYWAAGGSGVVVAGYGAVFRDSFVMGFYQGFYIPRGDRQVIENIKGDDWNGAQIGPSGDIIRINNIEFWPFFGANATYSPTGYDNYRGGVGFYCYGGANDTSVYNAFIYNYSVRFQIQDCQRLKFYGSESDGVPNLVNGATPISTTGVEWLGNSDGSKWYGGQISSGTNGAVVNLTSGYGSSTPLTTGTVQIIGVTTFQNSGMPYDVAGGNLICFGCLSTGGEPAPIITAASTASSVQLWGFNALQGSGSSNAFSIASGVAVEKHGGGISGYTDNLGELFNASNVNSNSNSLCLGTLGKGCQFQINATSGASSASSLADVWSTNGTGHFGVNTGVLALHADVANGVRPTVFVEGASTYLGEFDSAGIIVPISATVSAAGSTQGTCTTLSKQISVVTTVASSTGVCLPAPAANQTNNGNFEGLPFTVMNRGANTLNVYPPSGGQIESAGTNAAVTLTAGSNATFIQATSTQWYEKQ